MIYSTIGGGIVVGPDNKVVIVNQNHNSWSLPKGHIDPGEDEKQAAIREIREESGITNLVFIKKLGTYTRPKIGLNQPDDTSELKTITLFLFTTTQTKLQPMDPHNPEARWIDIDEVTAYLTHQKDKEFFESKKEEIKLFISSRLN